MMYEDRVCSGHLKRTESHQVEVNQMNLLRSENLDQENSWSRLDSADHNASRVESLHMESRGALNSTVTTNLK